MRLALGGTLVIRLPDNRIALTGGRVPRHPRVYLLKQIGRHNIFVQICHQYDLTRIDAIERLFAEHRMEV